MSMLVDYVAMDLETTGLNPKVIRDRRLMARLTPQIRRIHL